MDYRNVFRFSPQKLKIIDKSAKAYIAARDRCTVSLHNLPPATQEIIARLCLSLIGRFGYALLEDPTPAELQNMSDVALLGIGYLTPLPPYERSFITTPYSPRLFATTSERRRERRQWQQSVLATFEPGVFTGLTSVQEKALQRVLKDVSGTIFV
jgi:hypothetical protein